MTISYSSAKSKNKRIHESYLNSRLQVLEKNLSVENITEYNDIKKELEALANEYAKGIYLRSKAQFVEETEQNLKYFSQLENRNYKKKHIRSLYSGDTLITDPKDILEEEKHFYSTLYTKQKNSQSEADFDKLVSNLNLPVLTDMNAEICDIDLNIEELGKALRELPNNKSPGSDGMTTEFYKFFWPNIKEIVFDSLSYAYNYETLSIEQKRGILTLTPKKDKDLRLLKNWRPISLLNTDYKILAKTLSSRLQKVISSIIKSDQTGYIKGRYIGNNVRTIYDIIDYCNLTDKPGMVVFLDFEKAFDSISWDFLHRTLKLFNFGPVFRKWIQILYTNPECCVSNNGYPSSFFMLSRGIRQGCPISALLFIMVAEVMAAMIRNNKDIKGIECNGEITTISQLADDTTLFLQDENSLKEVLEVIHIFTKASGLKLNKDKTEAFWIGRDCNNHNKPLNIRWSKKSVKCLGIMCNANTDICTEENYNEKIKKVQTVLNIWSQRNLSLKGKIAVLRSVVLPQLLYIASVLYTPDWVITKVDNMMLDFLWSNKKHHVKKDVLIKEIENGGLKMPHFYSMIKGLKCTWIKRFLNEDLNRMEILKKFVVYRNINIKSIICTKLDVNNIKFYSNFYKQVFTYWFSLYSKEPRTIRETLETKIWHNKFITVDDKPICYKNWQQNGISHIYDIVDNNCNFLTKGQLENRFDCNLNYMKYNSVISAIPKSWKKKIKNNLREQGNLIPNAMTVTLNDQCKSIETVTCNDFYWEFISQIPAEPSSQKKWKKYLDTSDIEWEYLYKLPYILTRATVIQSFQYKIFHRFYPCNYMLSIWFKNESSLCNFCNEEIDYLEHFFYSCKDTNHFWNKMEQWWQVKFKTSIKLDKKLVLFGMPNLLNDHMINIFNLCILWAKWYISISKNGEGVLSLKDFLMFIKVKLEVEELICKLSDTMNIFEERWSVLYAVL